MFEINLEEFKLIPNKYNKFKFEYGAEIKKIYYKIDWKNYRLCMRAYFLVGKYLGID